MLIGDVFNIFNRCGKKKAAKLFLQILSKFDLAPWHSRLFAKCGTKDATQAIVISRLQNVVLKCNL